MLAREAYHIVANPMLFGGSRFETSEDTIARHTVTINEPF